MKMEQYYDAATSKDVYVTKISEQEKYQNLYEPIMLTVIEKVAHQIACDILEKNYSEIVSKISPDAIANMAIAEAGAKIHETLNKKLPDKILEIEKTQQKYINRESSEV
ncbi:hypothetical protein Cpap_1516 [Ruminiclostridium papyrosolvens DSM 2782]|uniref:Uncharacterized protein n=1 Tax=Ruminiclostridium papyrosolvens DSM 2782 TaxID=588581 RepID=F1TEF8_9FIRM|nr:hypothetical protein [Ruminiclostridium papyrosolvens]EGD47124.1 hypothetical protein Cpap_1516 [Ruminiclostridium papyrosolvens DSM 2782]WES36066.1 hypothetical protein P0092_08915 [Ruminiclostridium papyrosolvens DSM 2782]WES36164.1 hypothetical protein P0092_09415 [Ruminiclostridium papyrosolvens DSM 2782]